MRSRTPSTSDAYEVLDCSGVLVEDTLGWNGLVDRRRDSCETGASRRLLSRCPCFPDCKRHDATFREVGDCSLPRLRSATYALCTLPPARVESCDLRGEALFTPSCRCLRHALQVTSEHHNRMQLKFRDLADREGQCHAEGWVADRTGRLYPGQRAGQRLSGAALAAPLPCFPSCKRRDATSCDVRSRCCRPSALNGRIAM